MSKKLLAMISFTTLFGFIFLTAFAAANVNVPLNVDLKQKITTDLLPYSEYDEAVVKQQTIYIPERQGNKITAVNALDGKVKWEYATNANTAYYSFTGAGDVLFFQANGAFTALKDNGSGAAILWTKAYQASGFAVEGSTLYLFKTGKIAALDLQTGTEKWEYTLPSREKPHSNIAFGNGKVFFVTDNQLDMERKMYAINAETAQVQWTSTNVDYYATKLAFMDGKLYVKGYKEMHAFDSVNGLFLWKFLVQENFDFEMNATTIFTKTSNGNVAAYDRITKALRWSYKTGSFSRGPLIVTPAHIIANGDGEIKWLDSNTGQLVRNMTAPGASYQPLRAVEGALVAIDSSSNLYYYASANDTVKPSLTLEAIPFRYSPLEVGDARVNFHLSEDAYVKMFVKDSHGLVVRTVDFGLLNQGWHGKYWDGKEETGQTVTYGHQYTVAFQMKDLAGNEATSENLTKKMNIADIRGTVVEETISRKGPALTNEVLVTVPAGTQLTILDETADWYKVNFYVDSRGFEGYILKNAVATRSIPDPNATPETINTVSYAVEPGDTLWKISHKFGVTIQALVDANQLDPAKPLLVGQKLTIPNAAALVEPTQPTQPEPPAKTVTYTVQSGDTLWKIAQLHGVTIQAIVDTNQLDPAKALMIGQKLLIPKVSESQQPTQPAPLATITHTVQSGDTLWKIAQQHGVTIQAIVDTNQLDPAKALMIGQKLLIPKASEPAQPAPPATITHTVQSGDTLWKIAQQHGVTIQVIVDTNQLDPAKALYIGQQLTIPVL
ncbi:LysM peptidoglycan-binding domain-containing protein [Mesobacillus harenae]|uniref:LysM peptidoglycan-binding domain-containing protein n=1 Tax=Mesobacillus harenae TaxID=2213203 RepID=UPI001580A86A|nr:LysM peptidoglycan-binding domain-containing protein [Mesobacillus harenae]